MLTDSIADLLTRIRNAAHAGHETVCIRHSKVKEAIARLFVKEGLVSDVTVEGEGYRRQLVVALKYTSAHKPVFTAIERNSKPGRRIYLAHRDLKPIRQGMGLAILSTPKGIMTDSEARTQGVGGELICTAW